MSVQRLASPAKTAKKSVSRRTSRPAALSNAPNTGTFASL